MGDNEIGATVLGLGGMESYDLKGNQTGYGGKLGVGLVNIGANVNKTIFSFGIDEDSGGYAYSGVSDTVYTQQEVKGE